MILDSLVELTVVARRQGVVGRRRGKEGEGSMRKTGKGDRNKIIVKAFKSWGKIFYLLPFQGELAQTKNRKLENFICSLYWDVNLENNL